MADDRIHGFNEDPGERNSGERRVWRAQTDWRLRPNGADWSNPAAIAQGLEQNYGARAFSDAYDPAAHKPPSVSPPQGHATSYDGGRASWLPSRDVFLLGNYAGRGPRNYRRPDESILDQIIEALTGDGDVDATDIEVAVKNGKVFLSGHVNTRFEKHAAEDCALNVSGVRDVHNRIRVGSTAPAFADERSDRASKYGGR